MNGDGLSKAGLERKQAMLGDLCREVAARGRRRVAVRAGAGVIVVAILAAGGATLVRGLTGAHPSPAPERVADVPPLVGSESDPAPPGPGEPATPSPVILASEADVARTLDLVPRVRSEFTAMIRPATADGSIVARTHRVGQARIADASDELLAQGLRNAGLAAGVARVGDRVMVAPDREPGEG